MHGIANTPPPNPPRATAPDESERPNRAEDIIEMAWGERRCILTRRKDWRRKGLAYFIYGNGNTRLCSLRDAPPVHMTTQRYQGGKRYEELARGGQPYPVTHSRAIISQRERQ